MIRNSSKILNEFFVEELTKLVDKYNNIESDTIKKLEFLVDKVADENIKQVLMSDFNGTIALLEELGDDFDNDIFHLYFFITNNIKEISIVEAKTIYEEIEFKGFSILDDIILYCKLKDLREYVSDELDSILSCSSEIDRLFDKDTIIDYFLEGISIGEVASEMLDNYDEYEEILNIEPNVMFESEDGQQYYYAYINN